MALRFVSDFGSIKIKDVTRLIQEKKLKNVLALQIPATEYCTFEDLQNIFNISRFQIAKYLKKINVSPFGELRNMENGRYTRGVGRVVFNASIISQLKELVSNSVDTKTVKDEAMALLNE